MSGKPFILRVEGVDFASTTDDTQQLSAYRGGSLALLQAAEDVEAFLSDNAAALGIEIDVARNADGELKCRIFAGASASALTFRAPGEQTAETARAAVEGFLKNSEGSKTEAPHAFLSYVVDVAEGDDIAALRVAEARNRARQFRRSWALPSFEEGVNEACPDYDRIRPADGEFVPPMGKLLVDTDEPADGTPIKVSASFAARHRYGRTQRQEFYKTYAPRIGRDLKDGGFVFTNDFEHIVDLPENTAEEIGVPVSIKNKLAVFYADGNKFGELYRGAPSLEKYSQLSRRMRENQSALLEAALGCLRTGAKSDLWRAFAIQGPAGVKDRQQLLGLRFETLLWGGDELTFVMPAWLGLDFLDGFLETTRAWTAPSGRPLTFGVSLVFCHYKTPIRQARKVAKALAEDTKALFDWDAPESRVQIEAFESVALPDTEGGLRRYRERLYDVGNGDATERLLREAVTFTRDEWRRTYDLVKRFQGRDGDGFQRSQIYRLLRIADKTNAFRLDADAQTANDKLKEELKRYFERVGARGFTPDDLVLPGRPLAYSLAVFAALWDYAALSSEPDWPAFADSVTPPAKPGASP